MLTLSGAKGKHPCIFFLPRCALTGKEIQGSIVASLLRITSLSGLPLATFPSAVRNAGYTVPTVTVSW
jgi:hypothetical protein